MEANSQFVSSSRASVNEAINLDLCFFQYSSVKEAGRLLAAWPRSRLFGCLAGLGAWPFGRLAVLAAWPPGHLLWPFCRFCSLFGHLAAWPLGRLAAWPLGGLATWPLGCLATWPFGGSAAWPPGCLAVLAAWPLGRLVAWPLARFGRLATWPFG